MCKKFTILIILLAIFILIGGAFYWYEWRPTKIRKNCTWKQAEVDFRYIGGSHYGVKKGEWYRLTNDEYQKCLQEYGLEN